jgi:hypothetical protein
MTFAKRAPADGVTRRSPARDVYVPLPFAVPSRAIRHSSK